MTVTSPATNPTASDERATRPSVSPRRKRGEGQWALGYLEPLNANEQVKKDDDALNVRARIEKEGLGEAPYPPNFPKMPGEPARVQPSRARDTEA